MNPPIKPEFLLLFLAPVFIITMLAEYVLMKSKHPEWFDRKDIVNNFVLASLQQLSEILFLFLNWLFIKNLYNFFYSSGLKWVPNDMNFSWILVLFVAQDFLYYWFHRASHRIRWFWSAHVAHHSSTYLNFSTAFRQSLLYAFTGMSLFWIPLAFIGFSMSWIYLIVSINLAFQFFVHTRAVKSLGVLESIFNTPSHHRVHHAKNPQYIDKNYAGVFIIWDKFFGTYVPEKEQPVYGITKDVDFKNPITANFHEFKDMMSDVISARTLKEKVKHLFGPP